MCKFFHCSNIYWNIADIFIFCNNEYATNLEYFFAIKNVLFLHKAVIFQIRMNIAWKYILELIPY